MKVHRLLPWFGLAVSLTILALILIPQIREDVASSPSFISLTSFLLVLLLCFYFLYLIVVVALRTQVDEEAQPLKSELTQLSERLSQLEQAKIKSSLQSHYPKQPTAGLPLESIKTINYAFGELNKLRLKGYKDPVMVKNAFQHFCNATAESFSYRTGVDVSACIKVVKSASVSLTKPRLIEIMTFVRDKNSERERSVESYDNEPIILFENTDFYRIYRAIEKKEYKKAIFFCNDLPALNDYKNTRIKDDLSDLVDKGKTTEERLELRNKHWNLPYRSTIVLPILPYGPHYDPDTQLIGYICIDALEKQAFNRDIDVEVLRGMADTLYNYCGLISNTSLVLA